MQRYKIQEKVTLSFTPKGHHQTRFITRKNIPFIFVPLSLNKCKSIWENQIPSPGIQFFTKLQLTSELRQISILVKEYYKDNYFLARVVLLFFQAAFSPEHT